MLYLTHLRGSRLRTDDAKGDIMFCDPVEGIVAIPQDKVDEVLELLPTLTVADDKVKEAVEAGMTVKEAFTKHR